jgi:hypothetical protein
LATVVGGKGQQAPLDLNSSKNLTMAAGMEQAAAYKRLPTQFRAAIEAHPLVAQHGVQPHNAAALLQWSAPKGTPQGQELQAAMRRYMPAHAPTMASPRQLNPPAQVPGAIQA